MGRKGDELQVARKLPASSARVLHIDVTSSSWSEGVVKAKSKKGANQDGARTGR